MTAIRGTLRAKIVSNDLAIFDHDQKVGVAQRREPVGDRDRRAISHETGDRDLNALFRLGIDGTRPERVEAIDVGESG